MIHFAPVWGRSKTNKGNGNRRSPSGMTNKRQRQPQIPFGDDKQKGNGNRGSPSGMTNKKQRQPQIPFGDDKQKGNGNRGSPSGMTNKKATATADTFRR
jgi:hypothetical protein